MGKPLMKNWVAPDGTEYEVCDEVARQQNGGTVTVTKESIKNALGYTPANEDDIFHEETIPGINLFNLGTVTEDANLSLTTGAVTSGNSVVSDFIPVEAGKTYSYQCLYNGVNHVVTMARLCVYDSDKAFIESKPDIMTYEVPDGAAFIRFSVTTSRITNPMFFEGKEVTEYEPYGSTETKKVFKPDVPVKNVVGLDEKVNDLVEEKLEQNPDQDLDGAVLYTKQTLTDDEKAQARANIEALTDADFFAVETRPSINLLNLGEVTEKTNIKPDGTLLSIGSGSATVSDFIPVEAGKTYSFQGIYNGVTQLLPIQRIAAYNTNGDKVDYQEATATVPIYTYTAPEDAVTVRFSNTPNRMVTEAQPMFFEGSVVAEYEPYGVDVKIRGDFNVPVPAENIVGNIYSFRGVDAVCNDYSCETNYVEEPSIVATVEDADTGTKFRYRDLDYVYGLYDALMEAYPEYITETDLDKEILVPVYNAETGEIENVLKPIKRYDFTPPLPVYSQSHQMERFFKVLYCSGTHGGEYSPIMVGYRFFKDLCENWRTQDLLRALRFNVQFTVIPVVNPYGYAKGTRQNENQVDLNRNFSNGWHNGNNLVVGDTNYPGTHAASEVSTQLIEQMVANEPFDFVLDHHTYGPFISVNAETGIEEKVKRAGYFVSSKTRQGDTSFADMLSVFLSSKVVSDNTEVTELGQSYWQNISGTGTGGYLYGCVKNGFCFENMFGWVPNTPDYDEKRQAMEAACPSQKFNAETIGTIFHSALVGYHSY